MDQYFETNSMEWSKTMSELSSEEFWKNIIFKKAKKGLRLHMKTVKDNIEDAIEEKKELEAELDNIATNPDRWRI